MKRFQKLKLIRKLGPLPLLTNKKSKRKSRFNEKESINSNNLIASISNDFKTRLIEKQKLKFNFAITEKQLYHYILAIKKLKNKISLIDLINSRLDCILLYSGFSKTILEARQFISHGHVLLNNKSINISSNLCKLGDIITVLNNTEIIKKIRINMDKNVLYSNHFEFDKINLSFKLIKFIKKQDTFPNIDEYKILEYY